MKTTTVRKLLPEQWGFVCPVHTPDGGPCGLLNHISMSCVPLTRPQFDHDKHCDVVALCAKLGMASVVSDLNIVYPEDYY
jgi:DNA-directed RNA polymerase I subunit RPA2